MSECGHGGPANLSASLQVTRQRAAAYGRQRPLGRVHDRDKHKRGR